MNNCTTQDVKKWLYAHDSDLIVSDKTLLEICDLFNQLEFKTEFSSGYQEAHFYLNGEEFLSLPKNNMELYKLTDMLSEKDQEVRDIILKNEHIQTSPHLIDLIPVNLSTNPIIQNMFQELDEETRTRITAIFYNKEWSIRPNNHYGLSHFFEAIHDTKTLSPLLNHHCLQRINEFNLFKPSFLFLKELEKGVDLNALSDGELLKKLLSLDEAPTRKVVNFIKQFKDSGVIIGYLHQKKMVETLAQMNKEDFPQSSSQLEKFRIVMTHVLHPIDNDDPDVCPSDYLEIPYLKSSEYEKINFAFPRDFFYDLDLTKDYLRALCDIFPDYFEQNNKVKLLHLIEDSKVWHDNIANINSKISAHILEYSGIPKPAEKISILDMFPFDTKQGLMVKSLLDSQSLVEEGNQMNHCVGGLNYYYSILKGESFLFHLENSITGQESTLEVQYSSYSHSFFINQNYGYDNKVVDDEDAQYVLKQIQDGVSQTVYQNFVNRACLKQEDVYQVEKLLSENKNNYQYIKEIYAPYPLTLFKKLGKWQDKQLPLAIANNKL